MTAFHNPHLLLVITTLIWGGNAVAGKFAVGHISPMMLTMCRWAIALALISWIARAQLKKDWPKLKKHWLYILVMGGFGYTAFNYCMYSTLQFTSAINVALEQSAMPLIIFLLNYLFYKSGIRWLQIFGYLLTLFGVILVVSGGNIFNLFDGSGGGVNRGDIFMFGAALFYGGYSTALRSKPDIHDQSFLTGLIAAALLFSIAGVVVEALLGRFTPPTSTQGILVALYAGIFPSLVAQAFFIKGVEALGPNIAGLFINLVPIFGALLAVLLLNEQLHFFHAVAFVFVTGGIYIAQHKTA